MCDADSIEVLREALQARGLSVAGEFAELEERLVDAIAAEQSSAPDVSTMSIKELKVTIAGARMAFDDCLDKAELRARATEALASKATYQPMHETAAPPSAAAEMEQPSTADSVIMDQICALSLKDLKGLIQESGLSSDGCTDKAELRERACEAFQRLMVPGAKCGAIGKPLIAELRRQTAATAAAEASQAVAAKEAARDKQRAEAAAAEAAAAETAAAEAAAKRSREKTKRQEKKNRKKENKARAQAEIQGKEAREASDDEGEQEEEEAAALEDESDDMLRRLASARLHSRVKMVETCGGATLRRYVSAPLPPDGEASSDAGAVAVADAADTFSDGEGQDAASRKLPSGWRVERGLLLEEGEAAPVSKKGRPKKTTPR